MATSTVANIERDRADFGRALEMLSRGELEPGTQLISAVAERTSDHELHSQCLHATGQVLQQIGQIDAAYDLWWALAHKPPAQRNYYDLSARSLVMQLFASSGLRFRPPDFPPRVQVEVTNRCNLACRMCTRNQMTRPPADLSVAHLKKVADECSREPGAVIPLYFLGEPLLHPQLEDMVAYLASVRGRVRLSPLHFGIQTNGMLLDKARARALLEAGLREIQFSVDALGEALERLRPGVRYEVVERNILDLVALRGELGIGDARIAITKLCDDLESEEVRRFVEYWKGKVDAIDLTTITRVEGNSYLDAEGQLQTVGPPDAAGPRQYCRQGTRLIVLANGEFAFCHGDVDGEIRLGNIADRTIREVWNSNEIRRVRDRIRQANYAGLAPCERCSLGRA
jgi:radical SAM protein with 4Fe4S-binding SPASM domain